MKKMLCVMLFSLAVTALAQLPPVDQSKAGLMQDRLAFRTKLHSESASGETPDNPASNVFELVKYKSPAGDLRAYVSPDPHDGKKHPALLWAHGGFDGIGCYLWQEAPRENDQSVRAFLKKNIIVMSPSWRGENDNPGRLELFYGELDDLLAAISHLKALPYVDPARVYIAGHSTGGTLVLLAAVCTNTFRAAFSFGGAPDIDAVVSNGKGYGNTPYDFKDKEESYVRSAIHYVRFIQRPTFYFEGAKSFYVRSAAQMEIEAQKRRAPFKAYAMPNGTHFSTLAPTTELIAAKILGDTGTVCNIQFPESELARSWQLNVSTRNAQ